MMSRLKHAESTMERQLHLLVFSLADQLYALHLAQVQRVIRSVHVTPVPDAPEFVLGVIDLGGSIVPVMNTWKKFGMEGCEIGLDDQIILARASGRTIGLAVDRVQELVDRRPEDLIAAERFLDQPGKIAGAIPLEDGLVLIHDLERFLSADEAREMDTAVSQHASHE